MTSYTAKRIVKVGIGPATGNRVARILQPGDIVPAGIDQELLQSLEKRGLIEVIPEQDDVVEIPEGDPSDAWTGKQLKAYADANNIDLGQARNKPDVLTAIAAAKSQA